MGRRPHWRIQSAASLCEQTSIPVNITKANSFYSWEKVRVYKKSWKAGVFTHGLDQAAKWDKSCWNIVVLKGGERRSSGAADVSDIHCFSKPHGEMVSVLRSQGTCLLCSLPVVSLVAFVFLSCFLQVGVVSCLKVSIYHQQCKFTCMAPVFQHKCRLGLLITLVKSSLSTDLVVLSRAMNWSHARGTCWAALLGFLFCFPVAFSHLSPRWAHAGGATDAQRICWCSPAPANQDLRLSLGPAGGKSYQICFNMLHRPFFVIVVCLPDFGLHFHTAQQTSPWNNSQQGEDVDRCQHCHTAASLQLEIFCAFYAVRRECTLQIWKYALGKCLCWHEMFQMMQCTQHVPFLVVPSQPACVHRAPLPPPALSPRCHHVDQEGIYMSCRVSWEAHSHKMSWETQTTCGPGSRWMGRGHGAAMEQDINIKPCHNSTASQAMKQVISELWPSLTSLHKPWLKTKTCPKCQAQALCSHSSLAPGSQDILLTAQAQFNSCRTAIQHVTNFQRGCSLQLCL